MREVLFSIKMLIFIAIIAISLLISATIAFGGWPLVYIVAFLTGVAVTKLYGK